ncbi:GntR family transcriptional regulator [Bordetella pseudohinzii]|uniref:GntR family transcriptional regulator n=1 Tax=Bordetella pseudohinzii TaxID=1331258 RepID=A0A0J6C3N5_9BORD|nr:GntR family transcriptional regulator [Bordetella pseudohinzii]ANY16134.1 GntR family transcriptional regulator [Bordetella pseudohinzii]KMM25381.1 GntR family transcriptional regulator [Bordetella pseudohinzii]KXA76560.1 GntR family transcriptional regulator [Bordetella pseudohinzii]KXA81269.1 GntR family transcriptional regulator [Bordetella pseudohinzii]CUJ03730.1 transcriptional regulator NanR [Bordetella pseudohinzii]
MAARPTALQVDLARQIADDIAAGRHAVGDHLSEEALAKAYAVSRTPVRGALALLAAQGLITHRPNSGYTVAALTAQAPLPRLQGPTQAELYRRLIDDRARRALPETFTDSELQQRYGAPRAVLAKTLLQLSADGLIEKRKGHGWQFAPSLDSAEALAESYRFRMAIECAGLLEPAFRLDRPALARMRAAHEALLRREDVSAAEFFALNTAFHELLARCSGNRHILQAVQQQNQLRRLEEHAAFYRAARYADSSAEHLRIIEALEAGDNEWAAQLMRQHLKASLQAS